MMVIRKIQHLYQERTYQEDGAVQITSGGDVVRIVRLKEGISPQEGYARAAKRLEDHLKSHPAYAAYRKALHKFSAKRRYLVHTVMAALGNDPDGCWSALQDEGVHCDVEQLYELAKLYEAHAIEATAGEGAK